MTQKSVRFPNLIALVLSLGCGLSLAQERATVGLVLAGGGARGIAHAGVIVALEEMQIPVDAIAGTSMGALVGGLYASGMSAAELKEVVFSMDWERAFEDSVDRGELPMRRKGDDFDYPSQVQLSFKGGDVSLPLGLVQGQQVRLIIKELMKDTAHIDDFDKLPIPFRAVATDIETGDAYVFARGDIVTALRASMSLPGLLAPVEHDGRLLVDGGLANNIPVDVARTMNVDRLVVIDIGTPLMSRDEINSLLSVADQVLGFLTRRNSLFQLETLTDTDILIRPDLGAIGMLDFEQQQVIFQRGYEAAMALEEELKQLRVGPDDWQSYLASREIAPVTNNIVNFINIDNDGIVSDGLISSRINQVIGEPLDRDQLLRDIEVIYALDYWEIIDFEMRESSEGSALVIKARSKSWAGDKLKFGLNLITDLDGVSEFNLGASYSRKGVNALGGELYARAQLGDTLLLSGEFYQPLDLHSRFFVVPYLGWRDREVLTLGPEFNAEETVGKWRVRDVEAQFAGGINLYSKMELRLGVFRAYGEYEVGAYSDPNLLDDSFNEGGAFASFRYDSLDKSFFPSNGAFFYANYEAQIQGLGADSDFERWQLFGQTAYTFGADKKNTVLLTGRLAQSIDAPNQPQNYYQMGGLFNLSGVSQNLFSGRQMAFVMAQYQRRLTDRSVIPLDMPVYAGFSVEGGQLWSEQSDIDAGDLITSGSIYLAIDSPLGPLYLAYGRTNDSQEAIYFSLGWPFLSNNTVLGH